MQKPLNYDSQNVEIIEPNGTFEERTEPCTKCGGDNFYYFHKGPHIEIKCRNCDTFLNFAKQYNSESNWREYIKQRAKYTCERCGKKLTPRTAHAHHLLPQWFMESRKFDVNNGICLCKECHHAIHGDRGSIKEKEA